MNAATPWYQTSLPLLDDIARALRCPVDELRGHLMNQGVYVGPGERVHTSIVLDALEAEIAAGRGFAVRPLLPVRHSRFVAV